MSPALQVDSLPLSHLASPMECRATSKQKIIIVATRVEVIAQRWGLETDKGSKVEEPLRCHNFYAAWEPLLPVVVSKNEKN